MKNKFKVGDKVQIIKKGSGGFPIGTIGLVRTVMGNDLTVQVNNDWWAYHYSELKLINENMKEIKLSVEQARKMLGKDEAMDELIKANFSEDELKEKKEIKRWEDLARVEGYYIDSFSRIFSYSCELNPGNKNTFATENQARGVLAMSQLSQLMKRFLADNGFEGYKPNWQDDNTTKYCIGYHQEEIHPYSMTSTSMFLAFPISELRDRFVKLHRDLINESFLVYQ